MFKTMQTLLSNKNPSKEEIEKISPFILLRWLSNNPLTVIPANYININYHLPMYNQYRFLDDYFTLTGVKSKVRFIKYNKPNKDERSVENIEKYYNINHETALKYYDLMSDEERQRFKDLYKEGKV